MTVIVQLQEPPPINSADDVITQYLQKVLGSLTFENFQPAIDGNITIFDTQFHYRVGLFLNVPSEAIIAAGQFVKMKQVREKAAYWGGLKIIDPMKPDDCLYDFDIYRRWQPPEMYAQAAGLAGGSLRVQTQLFRTQIQIQAQRHQTLLGQATQGPPNPVD